jgi:hypothetical protein
MNPQTTVNYMATSANIARSNQRASRGWQAAEARAAETAGPAVPLRSRVGVLGAALALLAAVAGLGR